MFSNFFLLGNKINLPFTYNKADYVDFSDKAIEYFQSVLFDTKKDTSFTSVLSTLSTNLDSADQTEEKIKGKLLKFVESAGSDLEYFKQDVHFQLNKKLSLVKFTNSLLALMNRAAIEIRRYEINASGRGESSSLPKTLEPLYGIVSSIITVIQIIIPQHLMQNAPLKKFWELEAQRVLLEWAEQLQVYERRYPPLVEGLQRELENKTQALKHELDQKLAELTALKLDLETQARETALTEEAKAKMEDALAQKGRELSELQAQYIRQMEEKETAINELKAAYLKDIGDKEAALKESEEQLGKLEEIRISTQADYERACKEKAELAASLEQTEKNAIEARKEHTQLTKQLMDKIREISETQQTITQLQSKIESKSAEILAAQEKAVSLQAELERKKLEAEKAEAAAAELEHLLNEQREVVKQKDIEIYDLNSTLYEQGEQIQNLTMELHNQTFLIEELQRQNETLRGTSTNVSHASQISLDEAYYPGARFFPGNDKEDIEDSNPIARDILQILRPAAKAPVKKLLLFYSKHCAKNQALAATCFELIKELFENYYGDMSGTVLRYKDTLARLGKADLFEYLNKRVKNAPKENCSSEEIAKIEELQRLLLNFASCYTTSVTMPREKAAPIHSARV